MKVSYPEPVRDTLMACFCRILFGLHREGRLYRMWVRNELLKLVRDDDDFVLLHRRENSVYDRYRICQLFSDRFHINIEFPAEGLCFSSEYPYTLYLLFHDNKRFVQLLPVRPQHRPMHQVYDLRIVQDTQRCPVFAQFEPVGHGQLHQATIGPFSADSLLFTVHPRAGTSYELLVPRGQCLYVFADEVCTAVVGPGDPVNPYFYVEGGKRVTLSIIVCESISRARQFLQTELHGVH